MEQKILIQEAIDWIDGHLDDEVTLNKISRHIGYSHYHTSRLFKAFTLTFQNAPTSNFD